MPDAFQQTVKLSERWCVRKCQQAQVYSAFSTQRLLVSFLTAERLLDTLNISSYFIYVLTCTTNKKV